MDEEREEDVKKICRKEVEVGKEGIKGDEGE